MESISQFVLVSVESMESDSFNFTVEASTDNNLLAEININYGKNVSKGTKMSVSLDQTTNLTSVMVYYKSFQSNEILQELKICPNSYYYDNCNFFSYVIKNL